MRRRRLRFAALVVVIPVVLASCGGGGGGGKVSATDYASSVCTHIKTWLAQIKQRASDLKTAVSPGTSPQRGKDLLGSYLDGVISDTDGMINAIKDAGTPDVPNGSQISDTLVSGLDQAKAAFDDARSQVDQLPTNSRTAFAHAAEQLGTSINSKVGGVVQSFQGLKSPQLDQAFRTASACQGSG
jgi:hypothetical protein